MSNSWRPEGWKNPLHRSYTTEKEWQIFEAGTTAMLEALRKQPVARPRGTWMYGGIKGDFYFIPDDK